MVMPDDMSGRLTHQTMLCWPLLLRCEIKLPRLKRIYAPLLMPIQTVYTMLRDKLATTKNAIQTSITALEKTTASHENTIRKIEKSASHHSDDVTALQRQATRLNSEVEKLTEKCEDIERCSRRHNIRIIRIPKGTEGPWPRDFIASCCKTCCPWMRCLLLTERIGPSERDPNLMNHPDPIVLRLHYYHVLEDILCKAAAAKQLYHGGKRIQIFPDYLPAVAKRRALFNCTRELLRDKPGVRYGLLYPARLLITHNGTQILFMDPKKAEEYTKRLSASGSTAMRQEDI